MKEINYYIAQDGTKFIDEEKWWRYQLQLEKAAVEGQFLLATENGEATESLQDAYFINAKTDEAALFIQYWGNEEEFSNPFDCYNELEPVAGRYYYCGGGHWKNYEKLIKIQKIFDSKVLK